MATMKVKNGEEWVEVPSFNVTSIPEAPQDGKQYVRQNANWTEIIPGDKTNVLILDYEKDLANGKTGSTVTPEVSAALLDAVDKGKACVVKSGNSDILANLQKITDHVQIIMEQISYFEGTFLGSNTIVSVDTTGNTISNLSSGAIELVDKSNVLTKDNTKEFTPDADYEPATKKYVDDSLSSGNSDVFKIREAQISMGNTDPVVFNNIKEAITSGKSIIVYSEENSYSIAYGSIATGNIELIYSNIPGVLTKITISSEEENPISTEMTMLATDKNVLTKNNSTEYVPTENYHPATKKYVDDKPSTIKSEDGGSGVVTKELQPNVYYVFGECSSLTITLAAEIPNIYNEYMFQFTSGTAPTTLGLPSTVKWNGGNAPTIEASKSYIVAIVNNIAVIGGA